MFSVTLEKKQRIPLTYIYSTCHFENNILHRIGGRGCSRSWVRAPIGSNQKCKIVICWFSTKHATLKEGVNTGCLGIRIMFPSGATCLSADCCFSEVAIYNTQLRVLVYYKADLIIISLKIDLFSPCWKTAELALNINNSLTLSIHCYFENGVMFRCV